MIGRDIGAGFAGEHGEGLPHRGVAPPQPGDAEEGILMRAAGIGIGPGGVGGGGKGEAPFVLARPGLGEWRRGGIGRGIAEFIEAVERDQAAPAGGGVAEAAAFGPEVIERLAIGERPAPAAHDQFAGGGAGFGRGSGGIGRGEADDRALVGDPHAGGGLKVGQPVGKAQRDAELVKILAQQPQRHPPRSFIAHGGELEKVT